MCDEPFMRQDSQAREEEERLGGCKGDGGRGERKERGSAEKESMYAAFERCSVKQAVIQHMLK